MFRSVGWKMATIGPVPWVTSGAGHRYITYILWLLFMWPSLSVLLAKWIIAHTLWLICCRPACTIPFPVLVTGGFLVNGSHFLFVLWPYTGGLSSWNLLLFMCLCNHRHFKIFFLQFHEVFPFLATRTLILLLWVIAIKFFICLIKIWAMGCQLCNTTALWFEIHWLKSNFISPTATIYDN